MQVCELCLEVIHAAESDCHTAKRAASHSLLKSGITQDSGCMPPRMMDCQILLPSYQRALSASNSGEWAVVPYQRSQIPQHPHRHVQALPKPTVNSELNGANACLQGGLGSLHNCMARYPATTGICQVGPGRADKPTCYMEILNPQASPCPSRPHLCPSPKRSTVHLL